MSGINEKLDITEKIKCILCGSTREPNEKAQKTICADCGNMLSLLPQHLETVDISLK